MKGTPSEKGVPFKWSKQKSVCGISVVKRENRRSENCSDFQFWWTVRGSNPRPRRCERRALPAELTAQISHFSIKKVMKNGFLRYSILRGKSEKPSRKLEGKIGQVMEVHMDANRTLSRTRHSTGPTLLAKQGFLPALLGPVYCAGFLGDANHWEEASE